MQQSDESSMPSSQQGFEAQIMHDKPEAQTRDEPEAQTHDELPPRVREYVKPKNGIVQPPVRPRPTRPGRKTNQLQYIRFNVLEPIMAHHESWPFSKPVKAEKWNLPDYYSVIKFPMDLNTIKRRLINNYYWDAQECIEDFKLMFANCYLYYKLGEDPITMAQTLEKLFYRNIARIPFHEQVYEIHLDFCGLEKYLDYDSEKSWFDE